VFINAMIPCPGETPGEWWGNTGATVARTEAARRGGFNEAFEAGTYFLHDVPTAIQAKGVAHVREEAAIVFAQPCNVSAWPRIPIKVLAGPADRFFPL
jgi:hypothetical protein